LRVWRPRARDAGAAGQIEDLLLEQKLEFPILQLLAGRFMP
jgi:hypothetical protein